MPLGQRRIQPEGRDPAAPLKPENVKQDDNHSPFFLTLTTMSPVISQ